MSSFIATFGRLSSHRGFHAVFVAQRLKSALFTSSWAHRAIVAAWIGGLGLLLGSIAPWWAIAIAIGIPLLLLYNISALLQLLTEHRWLGVSVTDLQDYASRCVGRFCLAAPPPAGSSGLRSCKAWSVWGLRMLPLLLVRLAVSLGEDLHHDVHHLARRLGLDPKNWVDAAFDRERAIQQGDRYGLASREVYSLKEALDWAFDGLAAAAPIREAKTAAFNAEQKSA